MQAAPKKGKQHNRVTDLHFSASLNLEESASLIASLADNSHHIELIETSPDSIKFTLHYILNQTDEGKIEGTLTRWNYDETRVDCSGNVVPEEKNYLKYGWWIPVLWIILQIIASNVPDCFVEYCDSAFMNMFSRITLRAFYLTHLTCIGWVIMLFSARIARFFKKKEIRQINFRDRDRLFQLIIETFKSAGDVQAL